MKRQQAWRPAWARAAEPSANGRRRTRGGYTMIAYFGDSNTEGSSIALPTGVDLGLWLHREWNDKYTSFMKCYLPSKVKVVEALTGTNAPFFAFGYGGRSSGNLWAGGGSWGDAAPYPLGYLAASITDASKTLVVEMSGTNDIELESKTGAQTAAARIALWDAMAAEGLRWVSVAILPGKNSTNNAHVVTANALLAAEASARGIMWIPQPAGFDDGTAFAAGFAKADLIHCNSLGAQFLAAHIAGYIDPLMAQDEIIFPAAGSSDWAHPSMNTHFSGGTTYATGWSASGAASGATITASLVDDAEGRWQRLTVTGASNIDTISRVRFNAGALPTKDISYRLIGRIRASGGAVGGLEFYINNTQMGGVINGQVSSLDANPVARQDIAACSVASVRFPNPTSATRSQTGSPVILCVTGNGVVDFQSVGIVRESYFD